MQYYPDAKVLLMQCDALSRVRSMVEMDYSEVVVYQPPFNYYLERIVVRFGKWFKTQQGIRREEVHMDGIKDLDNPLELKSFHTSTFLSYC